MFLYKYSSKMKSINRKWILPTLLVILAIPFTLNILLQLEINSPISIIEGGEGGAVTWLQFWGSYLAAIGSLIMALIAYVQGVDAQNDNQKLRAQAINKTKYESIRKDYDILERIITNNVNLYTVKRFTHIGRLCENDQYSEARIAQEQLFNELNLSSVYAVRFISNVKELNGYTSLLKRYNEVYLDFAIKAKEYLNDYSKNQEQTVLVNRLLDICHEIEHFADETDDLTNTGVNALLSLKDNMDKTLEQHSAVGE